MEGLLALTVGVFLSLVPAAPVSCKTAILDPPRAPRHTLTPMERQLVLEHLGSEIPQTGNGPSEEPWAFEFTDVVIHKGISTVTFTVRDVDAGEEYPGQTCLGFWAGSVRALMNDRNGACQLAKGFTYTVKECLDGLQAGTRPLAGMPVPIPKK